MMPQNRQKTGDLRFWTSNKKGVMQSPLKSRLCEFGFTLAFCKGRNLEAQQRTLVIYLFLQNQCTFFGGDPVRRTANITLTILAVAAAIGCSDTREAEVKRCVDQNNKMADETSCEDRRYHGAGYYGYRYIYGGNGGYRPGDTVYGGSPNPTPGMESVPASRLAASGFSEGGGRVGVGRSGFSTAPSARGGFGSIGAGHAGHGAGE